MVCFVQEFDEFLNRCIIHLANRRLECRSERNRWSNLTMLSRIPRLDHVSVAQGEFLHKLHKSLCVEGIRHAQVRSL